MHISLGEDCCDQCALVPGKHDVCFLHNCLFHNTNATLDTRSNAVRTNVVYYRFDPSLGDYLSAILAWAILVI